VADPFICSLFDKQRLFFFGFEPIRAAAVVRNAISPAYFARTDLSTTGVDLQTRTNCVSSTAATTTTTTTDLFSVTVRLV
jgi:hypothetical protein